MELRGRLGALAERNFRLVFSSVTISALGDGVTTIALAFAVLKISGNSATAVGLVLALKASRGLAESRWRDRLVMLGNASFFVFAVHEPLVTVGKKLAFRTLPMTVGTVLVTYAVLPVLVIGFALVLHRILSAVAPAFLRVITGGR